MPATGFVLHLDRCCDALARRGLASGGFSVLVVGHVAGEAAAAIALATRLRRAGLPARRELRACAEDADVDVLVRGAGRVVWKGAGGRREVGIDDLLSQLTVGGYGNGVFGTRDAADVGAQ